MLISFWYDFGKSGLPGWSGFVLMSLLLPSPIQGPAPRGPQQVPSDPQEEAKTYLIALLFASQAPQETPRAPQELPEHPKTTPRTPHESPRAPQEHPKSIPRNSKNTPGGYPTSFQACKPSTLRPEPPSLQASKPTSHRSLNRGAGGRGGAFR